MLISVVCRQNSAYEMRIGGWSSDVCSSGLGEYGAVAHSFVEGGAGRARHRFGGGRERDLHFGGRRNRDGDRQHRVENRVVAKIGVREHIGADTLAGARPAAMADQDRKSVV